jgi:hypothetical protein
MRGAVITCNNDSEDGNNGNDGNGDGNNGDGKGKVVELM